MKKLIFIISLIIFGFQLSAQELTQDTSKKEFKNVIGLDITGLFRQVINYSPYDYYPYYSYYMPQYIISYKRIFNKNALRLSIGGDISNNSGTTNDVIKTKSNYYIINYGAGIEHYGYLASKWTYYYGMDLIGTHYKYDYRYENSSSSNDRKETTSINSYGIAPLLGIIFRLNKRISFATETSLAFAYIEQKSDLTYVYNPANNSKNKSTGFEIQYHAPVSLIIRLQF